MRAITIEDVAFVAARMRACDRAEIFATRWDECPRALARDCIASESLGAVFTGDDGTAIAVVGAMEAWPGTWSVWMFATERWLEVAAEATRFVRAGLIPSLIGLGARRAECRSAADHHRAHRWLEHLGAKRESIHPDYGKNGETFYGYCWRANDVRQSLRTPEDQDPESRDGAAEERRGGGCGL